MKNTSPFPPIPPRLPKPERRLESPSGLGRRGGGGLSSDWKFGIAYNAALKLCTMLLYNAGYMPEKSLAHYRTLLSIVHTLGPGRQGDADYLDACRNPSALHGMVPERPRSPER